MVEHLVWDQGVAGSNPVFPISKETRGLSSAGRAPALHAGGQRFDPARLHIILINKVIIRGVAQLARASGSYPGGRGFDPLRRDFLEPGPLAQLVRADGS